MLKFCFAPVLVVCSSGAFAAAPEFSTASVAAVKSSVAYESEAAIVYHRALTGTVIPSNYLVHHYSYLFSNSEELRLLLGSFRDFKGFIGSSVLDLCLQQGRSHKRCEAAVGTLLNTYVEVLEGDVAAMALAAWFYRLDGNNWFNYDSAYKVTLPYLQNDARKLYVLKGWRPDKVLVDKLTERDLPVVVDMTEKTVTFWTNELED
jgi:hypothetical protein